MQQTACLRRIDAVQGLGGALARESEAECLIQSAIGVQAQRRWRRKMQLELLINNEQRVRPSVQAFVHQTLAQLSLPDEDAENIERFVLRAVLHRIEHA